VLDTEARVALASDDAGEAIKLARRAVTLAEESGNQAVQLGAMLTEARALRATGEVRKAESQYAAAADIARAGHYPARLRDVLREWSELRAETGDHRGAYELTREALGVN
jgi:hypothetical protein